MSQVVQCDKCSAVTEDEVFCDDDLPEGWTTHNRWFTAPNGTSGCHFDHLCPACSNERANA